MTNSKPGEIDGDSRDRIAQVCETMLADLDSIAESALRAIRTEVPEYEALDSAEHRAAVVTQFRGILSGLAAGRGPGDADSEAAFLLGRTRAQQHISVQSVIGAYHVGYRLVWNTLRDRVDQVGFSGDPELVRRVDTVWSWVRQAAGAAADGHGEYARFEDQTRTGAMQTLVELLFGGAVETSTDDIARQAGFDSSGSFRVIIGSDADFSLSELARLNRDLPQARPRIARAAFHGGRLVTITQGMEVPAVIAALRRHAPLVRVGVGLSRDGMHGAAESAREAADAFSYVLTGALEDGDCWFEHSWFDILTVSAFERLGERVHPAMRVAKEHPDLADTAWQHLEHRLSFVRTAEIMHLHPNSVRYRLERWTELTGWGFDTSAERALTRLAIQSSRRTSISQGPSVGAPLSVHKTTAE